MKKGVTQCKFCCKKLPLLRILVYFLPYLLLKSAEFEFHNVQFLLILTTKPKGKTVWQRFIKAIINFIIIISCCKVKSGFKAYLSAKQMPQISPKTTSERESSRDTAAVFTTPLSALSLTIDFYWTSRPTWTKIAVKIKVNYLRFWVEIKANKVSLGTNWLIIVMISPRNLKLSYKVRIQGQALNKWVESSLTMN